MLVRSLFALVSIGTAVSSSQLRGRATRVRPVRYLEDKPTKVANSTPAGSLLQPVVLDGASAYSHLFILGNLTEAAAFPFGTGANLTGNYTMEGDESEVADFQVLALTPSGLETLFSSVNLNVGSPESYFNQVLTVPSKPMTAFSQSASIDQTLAEHIEVVKASANGTLSVMVNITNELSGLTFVIWWYKSWPMTFMHVTASVTTGFVLPVVTTVVLPGSYTVESAAYIALPDATTTSGRAVVAYSSNEAGDVSIDLWATDGIRWQEGQDEDLYNVKSDSLVAVNITTSNIFNKPFLTKTVVGGSGNASYDFGDAVPPGVVWLAVNTNQFGVQVTGLDVYLKA